MGRLTFGWLFFLGGFRSGWHISGWLFPGGFCLVAYFLDPNTPILLLHCLRWHTKIKIRMKMHKLYIILHIWMNNIVFETCFINSVHFYTPPLSRSTGKSAIVSLTLRVLTLHTGVSSEWKTGCIVYTGSSLISMGIKWVATDVLRRSKPCTNVTVERGSQRDANRTLLLLVLTLMSNTAKWTEVTHNFIPAFFRSIYFGATKILVNLIHVIKRNFFAQQLLKRKSYGCF